MNTKICAAIPSVIVMMSAPAFADNCDRNDLTGFDSVYCFAKVYIGEDNRLNANYKSLRQHLTSSQKKQFCEMPSETG